MLVNVISFLCISSLPPFEIKAVCGTCQNQLPRCLPIIRHVAIDCTWEWKQLWCMLLQIRGCEMSIANQNNILQYIVMLIVIPCALSRFFIMWYHMACLYEQNLYIFFQIKQMLFLPNLVWCCDMATVIWVQLANVIFCYLIALSLNQWWITQIAKFMRPTWGPPGSCRPQMGPILAPWTLLSGYPDSLGNAPHMDSTSTHELILQHAQNHYHIYQGPIC